MVYNDPYLKNPKFVNGQIVDVRWNNSAYHVLTDPDRNFAIAILKDILNSHDSYIADGDIQSLNSLINFFSRI